jgi:signal-transduction protein with cAMP-binding, CBS, and nucleotidyltransferase domain
MTQATAQPIGPGSPVSSLVHRSAVGVQLHRRIGEVARVLRDEDVSAVLVGPSPEGLVTERDLTRALAAGIGPEAQIAPVVVREPVAVAPTTTVLDATAIMLREHIRHLVIVTPGQPTAIISLRDTMEVLLATLHPGVWAESLRIALTTQSELWLG